MKKFENYLVEWEKEFEENVTSSSDLYAYYRTKENLQDIVYRITFNFRLVLIDINKKVHYFSDDEIHLFLEYLSETDTIDPKYLGSIFDLYDVLKETILNMVMLHYEKENTIEYYTNDGDTIFIEPK